MGILYIENFSAWAAITSSVSEVDFLVNTGGALSLPSGNRASTQCFRGSYATGNTAWYHKNLPRSPSTIWVTWRSSCDGATSSATCNSIIQLQENGGPSHVVFGYTNNYELCAYNNNKTVRYGTGPVLTQGSWHQFVAKVFISDTVGTIEVRMDGIATPILNLTGLDTKNGGSGVISRITIGETFGVTQGPAGTTFRIMDLAVWDNDGNSPSDWVGDVRVDDYTPSGAGSSTQWTPLSGTNYSNVDEAAADYDTTYVYTTTNGYIDLYPTADITHNPPNIYSVSANVVAKKVDAGTAQLKTKLVSGATTSTGTAETLTMGTYLRYYTHYGANPDTATAWTVATVNAVEVGFESVL